MVERRKDVRRLEDNGWPQKKALVMEKLENVEKAIVKLEKTNNEAHDKIDMQVKEVAGRFHVAPCTEILDMKEESGGQKQRLDDLKQRLERMVARHDKQLRNTYVLIGLVLTAIGLLLGLFVK